MATQLTRRTLLSALRDDAPVVNVPLRYLVALAAGCVAFAYASLFAAIYNAQRDESAAEERYANTRTVIEAPPANLDALTLELMASGDALQAARDLMQPPAIDPASDEMATLLVTRAQQVGVTVTSVARIEPSQVKVAAITYDVQAIRLTVDGSARQVEALLAGMHREEPALIATLTSIRFEDTGKAEAELLFSAYARAPEVTPVAGGAP